MSILIKSLLAQNPTSLDLSFNNLTEDNLIFEISFSKMSSSLSRLVLKQTCLDGIFIDFLSVLTSLTHIDLSDNFIRLHGSFMPNSQELKRIYISNINLTTLDLETYFNFGNFEKLKNLDLSCNYLEIIKTNYFRYNTCLVELILAFNILKLVESRSFSWSAQLDSLDLTSYKLVNFQWTIFMKSARIY
jgi:hypothetical protein